MGWLTQGVAPAEAGETPKVEVVGMDLGLVFDGKGGDVGVVYQVAAYSGRSEVPAEKYDVVRPGVDGRDVGELEPFLHEVESRFKACRTTQWSRPG